MTTTSPAHYSHDQVLCSEPRIQAAAELVMMNALPGGASDDRMFLRVSKGSLAGVCLNWDAPSRTWIVRTA